MGLHRRQRGVITFAIRPVSDEPRDEVQNMAKAKLENTGKVVVMHFDGVPKGAFDSLATDASGRRLFAFKSDGNGGFTARTKIVGVSLSVARNWFSVACAYAASVAHPVSFTGEPDILSRLQTVR